MKAAYTEVWFAGGEQIIGPYKEVEVPFSRLSARAVIVRRRDGALLGTLHKRDGRYALPGGQMDNGETTLDAVKREIREENISLTDPDWDVGIGVDYFHGYCELSVWHIVLVTEAEIGECEENIRSRWLSQDQDLWYPTLREKLILYLARYLPELVNVSISLG